MDSSFFLNLIQNHFGSILVFLLVLFTWIRGGTSQVAQLISRLEKWYDVVRLQCQERELYSLAEKAYGFANDQARQLAKKTATDLDDKIVDKTAIALAWALKAMKKAGLDSEDSEDVLKGYFGYFHDAERKAKELSGNLARPQVPNDSI